MSEIVYTETHEDRSQVDVMPRSRIPTDTKYTLFRAPNKVALVTSTLVCGKPRGTDKRYYYWKSIHSFGFRRNHNGTIIPFECQRAFDATKDIPWRHRQARKPFEFLSDNTSKTMSDELVDEYRYQVRRTFDFRTTAELFPMMEQYGLYRYETIPYTLHNAFRTDGWWDYAARAFGKTRVTARLINAVMNTDPWVVAYALNFRGLVGSDVMSAFMEKTHFDEEVEERFSPFTPDFRSGLLHAEPETIDALISVNLDMSDIGRIRNLVGTNKNYMRRLFKPTSNGNMPTTWTDVQRW